MSLTSVNILYIVKQTGTSPRYLTITNRIPSSQRPENGRSSQTQAAKRYCWLPTINPYSPILPPLVTSQPRNITLLLSNIPLLSNTSLARMLLTSLQSIHIPITSDESINERGRPRKTKNTTDAVNTSYKTKSLSTRHASAFNAKEDSSVKDCKQLLEINHASDTINVIIDPNSSEPASSHALILRPKEQ